MWIKNKQDKQSFQWIQTLGGNVYELEDPEKVDQMIENLYKKEECHTVILSNELAGFSEDIIKKYQFDEKIRIIIAPVKKTGRKV